MLKDKFGIIFGVANKRSIAWATAQALHEAGASLAFTYQGDRLKENVEGLTAQAMPGSLLLPCDVTKQEEVDATFKRVGEELGRLDFLIHSIAYAPREALGGEYLDTSREAFLTALLANHTNRWHKAFRYYDTSTNTKAYSEDQWFSGAPPQRWADFVFRDAN